MKMYCSQCGSENDGTSKFCHNCGHQLEAGQAAATLEQRGTILHKTETSKQGTVYVVLGWIFFAISFLVVPILFGAGAFVMGFMTYRVRSQVHGVILMVFSVVGILLGSLIGFIVGMSI
jgi:Zn-dependent membrane protease YugP